MLSTIRGANSDLLLRPESQSRFRRRRQCTRYLKTNLSTQLDTHVGAGGASDIVDQLSLLTKALIPGEYVYSCVIETTSRARACSVDGISDISSGPVIKGQARWPNASGVLAHSGLPQPGAGAGGQDGQT